MYDSATLEPTLELLYNSKRIKHGKHCLNSPQKWLSDYREYDYRSCPCQWSHPQAMTLWQCAVHMRNGVMPFDGGVMDQPAIFWEMLQITASFLSKKEAMEQKLAAQSMKSQKR